MKEISSGVGNRIASSCSKLDNYTMNFCKTHANLLTALAALVIFIWGCVGGHIEFVFGTIIVGAVSYFAGLSIALLFGVFFTILDVLQSLHTGSLFSTIVLEIVEYIFIAWLGYGHREQQVEQKYRALQTSEQHTRKALSHQDQVLPWAVANEVRTSLAAVRFLLFPLHGEHTSQELQQATNELSRLEKIFTDFENDKEHHL